MATFVKKLPLFSLLFLLFPLHLRIFFLIFRFDRVGGGGGTTYLPLDPPLATAVPEFDILSFCNGYQRRRHLPSVQPPARTRMSPAAITPAVAWRGRIFAGPWAGQPSIVAVVQGWA